MQKIISLKFSPFHDVLRDLQTIVLTYGFALGSLRVFLLIHLTVLTIASTSDNISGQIYFGKIFVGDKTTFQPKNFLIKKV